MTRGGAEDRGRGGVCAFDEVLVVGAHGEARAAVAAAPQSLAVVERGEARSVLFRCPCGCGDVLVVNVDPGAGPAWKLRRDVHGVTLLPSVWRTTGCHSHFVLWRGRVWWCRYDEEAPAAAGREDAWPDELTEELLGEWRRRRGS